ncbi:MAG: hypothetical protein ACKOQM_15105 [Novosphingobium sp.]
MLRGILAALLALLLLSGCGSGSEDFSVQIARPTDRVKDVLGRAAIDTKFSGLFPGLRIERSAPSKDEVLYTVPGDGSFPATIRLTFEALDGGKATVVHAAVDVPPLKLQLEGKAQQISEFKVERALRKIVEDMRSKLEEGGDVAQPSKDFSELLSALALVTDSKQLKLALDMERNPDWYMGRLGSIYGGDDGNDNRAGEPAPAYGNPAFGEDPNAPARRQQYAEKARAEEASRPMNDAQGVDPGGDNGSGED